MLSDPGQSDPSYHQGHNMVDRRRCLYAVFNVLHDEQKREGDSFSLPPDVETLLFAVLQTFTARE